MARKDYVPSKDAELLSYGSNFSAKLTLSPTTYGQVAADATALSALLGDFRDTMEALDDPDLRTKPKVAAKNTAKAKLVAYLRALSQRIQTCPTVTAEQKEALGLPIRDHQRTPLPAPVTMPVVHVAEVRHGSHIIRLFDQLTPTSRANPQGIEGAEILVHVGDTPPVDLQEWELKGLTTRTQFEIPFSPADAGKTAHVIARWYCPRGLTGPASAPVSERIAA